MPTAATTMATQVKKRLTFARAHLDKTPAAWKSELQAVGDIKEFTYYPRDLRPKLAQLRAPWTYMTAAEKKKPEFQRPKRWYPQHQHKGAGRGASSFFLVAPEFFQVSKRCLKVVRLFNVLGYFRLEILATYWFKRSGFF